MKHLLQKTAVAAGVAGVVYLILYFFYDQTVDLWVNETFAESWLFRIGTWISYAATGPAIKLAIAICLILVVAIDPGMKKRWTRNLLYICVCCSIAVVIGEGLKYLLGRSRPTVLFEQSEYGLNYFSTEWALNSSPSGHTLRAFSVLTACALLFRRLAPVFLLIALLIGASRVLVTAHYPSDVVFGAFIGITTSIWTYRYFFGTNPKP